MCTPRLVGFVGYVQTLALFRAFFVNSLCHHWSFAIHYFLQIVYSWDNTQDVQELPWWLLLSWSRSRAHLWLFHDSVGKGTEPGTAMWQNCVPPLSCTCTYDWIAVSLIKFRSFFSTVALDSVGKRVRTAGSWLQIQHTDTEWGKNCYRCTDVRPSSRMCWSYHSLFERKETVWSASLWIPGIGCAAVQHLVIF